MVLRWHSKGDEERARRAIANDALDRRFRQRAAVLCHLADGASLRETARLVGLSHRSVAKWRDRYQQDGFVGLSRDYWEKSSAKRGRPTAVTAENLAMLRYEEVLDFECPVSRTMEILGVCRSTAQKLVNALNKTS